MTATLSSPVEVLFREQVGKGNFSRVDDALGSAVKTVFGRRAHSVLESALDEAIWHPVDRMPLSLLRKRC